MIKEAKDFITIAGEMYMLKGKRFVDDEGHRLPAEYEDGEHTLPQEYIYEGEDGVELRVDGNHPSQG